MQRHFKPASKPGLAGVSPGDDVFLIAQESDTPVFPPSSADLEDLRIAKTAWVTTYAEADDEDSMASARELSHKYESLEAARSLVQRVFDNLKQCIATARAAEIMELGLKVPDVEKAGNWKLLRLKLQKRMAPYDEQQREAAAAAAAAASEARKRKPAVAVPDAAAAAVSPPPPPCSPSPRFLTKVYLAMLQDDGGDIDSGDSDDDNEGGDCNVLGAAAHASARERQSSSHTLKKRKPGCGQGTTAKSLQRKGLVTRATFEDKISSP